MTVSWDDSVYIEPAQRWVSNDDPTRSILVETTALNRWLVRSDHGDVVEMTGAQIRSLFHFATA